LSQYQEGSNVGGQGNGTVGTLSNAELWRLYWSGAGAGSSSSGSDEGSLGNDPTISAQYTGGSGGGRITPLVYNPESDGPPVFHSGVFTGDHGSVQFVQTADTGNQGTGEGDASESDDKSRARSWWGIRGWFLGDEPIDDGGPQVVQTADTGNQGTGEGDEPGDESEPPAKSWWSWFIGDDPIKGSLWKLGPSHISRAGDRPTHNDDKSAVESFEDCGKYTKEIIDGAKRDGALAGAGAVVGRIADKRAIEMRQYGGPGGGHHTPPKKAFEGAAGYDKNKALAIPNDVMELLGIRHPIITGEQARLYNAFSKTGKSLTWEVIEEIETQSLIKGGADASQALDAVRRAIRALKDAGVAGPTRIPWGG
jgi:hypothetical protein